MTETVEREQAQAEAQGEESKSLEELNEDLERLQQAAARTAKEQQELAEKRSALFDEDSGDDDSIALLVTGKLSRSSQKTLKEIDARSAELQIVSFKIARAILRTQLQRTDRLLEQTESEHKEAAREVTRTLEAQREAEAAAIEAGNVINYLENQWRSLREQRQNFEGQLYRLTQTGKS